MAIVISGKELSVELKDAMRDEVLGLVEKYGRAPHLAVVLVGNNPSSISYVSGKEKACEYVGIKNTTLRVDESISEEELVSLIEKLNEDDTVDGILVQLPLPKHISEERIIETILYGLAYFFIVSPKNNTLHQNDTGQIFKGL